MLYLSVILVGGILIGTGEAQASDLVVYILYINIFLNPIEKLVNFTEQFQKGITGFERFLEILNTKPEIEDVPGSIDLKNPKGEIEFKDVTFSYDSKSTVLEGINIKIEKGKTVALVGSSGSGKTTLCNLIPRFYEVDSGVIKIDGKNIRNIKLKSLRDSIGVVQQDVYMFAGTIKENIATVNQCYR